jgi:hypothetical protein
MTDPLRARLPESARRTSTRRPSGDAARTRRGFSSLAAAGLVGAALAPGLGALPASAATEPESVSCAAYGAGATADLLRLNLLDLRPVRPGAGNAADVRLSSTQVGAANGRSAAAARYLQARLLGTAVDAGVLTTAAYQQAPPVNPQPATITALRPNLGALSAGSGDLHAHALPTNCAKGGPTAQAGASLVDATVLPSGGRSLVRVPANLNSTTVTAIEKRGPRLRATATATARLARLELFAGTSSTIRVEVVSEPRLHVVAAGSATSSTVEYTNPVLRVTLPGEATPRTIDQTNRHIDVAVPAGAAGGAGTGRLEGLPTLPGNPLTDLLGTLPAGLAAPAAGATGGASGGANGGANAGATGGARGNGSVNGGTHAGTPGAGGAANGSAGGAANGSAGGAANGGANGGAEAGSLLPGTGPLPGLPALPGLGSLPGLPALPDVTGDDTGAAGGADARGGQPRPGTGEPKTRGTGNPGTEPVSPAGKPESGAQATADGVVVLRLSIGELTKKVTDTGVHASAASLRVQLAVRARGAGAATSGAANGAGQGSLGGTSLCDLGIGVLDAQATAPKSDGYGGSGGEQGGPGGGSGGGGGGNGGGNGGGGNGGGSGLPVTGAGIGAVVGAGTALLVVGRLLMLLTRRRTPLV